MSSTNTPLKPPSKTSTIPKYAIKPRFQIPVHVLVYSIMLTPVAAFYIYYDKNKKTDEELEKILRKDEYYQQKIQNNQVSNKDSTTISSKIRVFTTVSVVLFRNNVKNFKPFSIN